MAIVAILLGSLLGFFTGVIGFIFFDMSLAAAVGIYILSGVGMGALTTGYIVLRCAISMRNQMTTV